jgi:hypothetical protein
VLNIIIQNILKKIKNWKKGTPKEHPKP